MNKHKYKNIVIITTIACLNKNKAVEKPVPFRHSKLFLTRTLSFEVLLFM